MTPALTIAIPTFNRPAELARAVAALVPQLTPATRLLVLDNLSTPPAAEVVAPLLAARPGVHWEVVRHPYNIGGDANIVRCLERAAGWVWVLGDDDLPWPDAVARILADVAADPGAVWINYSSEVYVRPVGFRTVGRRAFVEGMDSFGNAVFISASVLNVPRLAAGMRAASRCTYSMAAPLGVLLTALGEDGVCVFSDRQIVTWDLRPEEQAWSSLDQAVAVMTVTEVLADHRLRVTLARKILPHLPAVGTALGDLANRSRSGWADRGTCVYYMDQLCGRTYVFVPGLGGLVKRTLARLLIRVPGFTLAALQAWRRVRGRSSPGRLAGRDRARM